MDFVLKLKNPLFYEEVAEMHKVLYAKLQAVEEMAYSWMDDILEDAKKAFSNQSDLCILPKTPAAKQKGRRKKAKQMSENARQLFTAEGPEDDYVPPNQETQKQSDRTSRKKRVAYASSDDDFEEAPSSKVSKVEKSPVRKRTRAASRAATTSQAKNTRSKRGKPTHKSRSQEPIQNLEKLISDSTQDKEADITVHEVIEEWTQPASQSLLTPTVSNKGVSSLCKTPIQNFNSMNVKEKAHAYEEILLISETPVTKSAKKDIQTPVNRSVSPRTPTNAPIPQSTPETIVRISDIYLPAELPAGYDSDIGSSPKPSHEDDKTSSNSRRSIRKSLKVLPSAAKISAVHQEPEAEPARARTRLRLKKKKKSDTVEDDEATVTSDDQEQTEATVDVSTPQNKRRTRSQGQDSGLVRDQPDKEGGVENMETEDITENEKESEISPKPTRSTRTKTRQAHAQSAVERLKNDDKDSSDSGCSVETEGPLRVTRSKLRKPKTTDVDSDNVVASPAVSRSTRTKTRKRQHDEESDIESRKPKRSCTASALSGEENNTPRAMSTDDSSDEETESPMCPANKVVRPVPSFLNGLNKNSKNPVAPSHLNTTGVKSFIMRNSPAPKLNMKDIQEKRRQELQEKQRKEQERLNKRDEENKRRMEEMRKKREEKMKKVQELKEQREQEERNNRMRIEKRLAEKRQVTQKIREEKIKEDNKEKQKLRLQKMEEAEERRKQEEDERRKKFQDQHEQEKFHEAMLQRKKEFEEQERQQKIEEEKRRAVERQQEIERERERERERLLKVEEEKNREWQKKKEEKEKQIVAERAERERMEFEKKRERELQMKKEMDRIKEQERLRLAEQDRLREEERKRNEEIKKMVDKHNNQIQQNKALPKPEFNKTRSIEEPTVAQHINNDSYEMTPKRKLKASTAENYGIEDLNSGDDTDDDECPRKRIPDWAQGSQLKTLLIRQHYNPPNLDAMFDAIEPPDLNVLFEKKKARFNKRTSSAHWDTPILKPGMLGRT